MKCSHCGREFEGNFCPFCGTARQETCPVCGSVRRAGENFCSNCGRPFSAHTPAPPTAGQTPVQSTAGQTFVQVSAAQNPVQPTAGQTFAQPTAGQTFVQASAAQTPVPPNAGQTFAQPTAGQTFVQVSAAQNPVPPNAGQTPAEPPNTAAGKLYRRLRFLPATLFGLFAVLLFAFFAAPVAAMQGMAGLFGADFGNVYSMTPDLPSLAGSMGALIAFAVLAVVLAAGMAAQYLVPACRERSLTLFGKTVRVEALLSYAAYAMYFIFFLLGCIVCGQIAAEDGGMGMLAAGACPVLIIVFSLLFAAISVAVPFVRKWMRRKYPDDAAAAGAEERLREKSTQTGCGREKAQTESGAADLSAAPTPVQKPRFRRTPELAAVNKYVHFKRWMAALLGWFFLAACIIVLTDSLHRPDIKVPTDVFQNPEMPGLTGADYLIHIGPSILLLILVVAAVCIFGMRLVKRFPEKKIRQRGGMIAVGVLYLLCALSIVAIFICTIILGVIEIDIPFDATVSFIGLVYGFLFSFVMGLVTLIGTRRRRKKVLRIFYGTEKPEKDAAPVVTYEELLAPYCDYIEQRNAYRAYLRERAAYMWQIRRRRAQKPYEPVPKAAVFVRVYRTPLCISAAAVVAVIVAVVVAATVLGNIFRIAKVEKVNLGDSPEQVLSALGEPYGYDTRGEAGSSFSDYSWEYYSKNYQDLLDREQSAELEDFGDWESALELAEALERTAYAYIEILFSADENGEDLVVSSVFFDPSRLRMDDDSKEVQDREVLSVSFEREDTHATVEYTVTYTDGSYYKATAYATVEDGEFEAGETVTVTWSDRYSNQFQTQTHVEY